jgi:hypothetical protein
MIVLFSCKGEIQMKNLLIIVFWKINNKKIEEKENVQKTLLVVLFDFVAFKSRISLFACATFGHHVVLWTSAPFGHSNYGSPRLEFMKLEERKRRQWYK